MRASRASGKTVKRGREVEIRGELASRSGLALGGKPNENPRSPMPFTQRVSENCVFNRRQIERLPLTGLCKPV